MAKSRWFRFSLRTLFVLVTVVACWLGWNLRIVRERKAVLAELVEAQKHYSYKTTAHYVPAADDDLETGGDMRISLVRRLMGDVAYREIYLPENTPPELLERAEYAIAETRLTCDWWDGPSQSRFPLNGPDGCPYSDPMFKTGHQYKFKRRQRDASDFWRVFGGVRIVSPRNEVRTGSLEVR